MYQIKKWIVNYYLINANKFYKVFVVRTPLEICDVELIFFEIHTAI